MSMIECISMCGDKKLVSKERLVFRPSVYAVVPNDGNVLLVNTRSTGKYFLPGGGIEIGERIEDALVREVKEETGIEIEIKRFLHFQEQFFYYNPLDEAYHSFLFYYFCKPRTLDLIDDDLVEDIEAVKPRWTNTQTLKEDDFHDHGGIILRLLHSISD